MTYHDKGILKDHAKLKKKKVEKIVRTVFFVNGIATRFIKSNYERSYNYRIFRHRNLC